MQIGTGILELITALLLFVTKATWLGALLATSLMNVAIISHLTQLPIAHNKDCGALFKRSRYFCCCSNTVIYRKKEPINYRK
jgi:hypothetical protein